MFSSVSAFVLLAALLHATWNALLHGNRDRYLSISWMSLAIVPVSALAVLLLPAPLRAAWPYLIASGLIHIGYNASLVHAYRTGDLGEAYPIARGSSPLLVALGAALFAHERLTPIRTLGVALVSGGIISLALARGKISRTGTFAALATGAIIAVYTVIDGAGVRVSGNAASYTAWMFLFYLGTPLLFVLSRGIRALRAPARDIGTSMAGGLVSIAAYGIVIWAMQFGPMGAVSALRETSVLFAAFIGQAFLREKLTPRAPRRLLRHCFRRNFDRQIAPGQPSCSRSPACLFGLQTVTSVGLQTVTSVGLQTVVSVGLQTVTSVGLQTVTSVGLQTVTSVGLQTAVSVGLQTVQRVFQLRETTVFIQIATELTRADPLVCKRPSALVCKRSSALVCKRLPAFAHKLCPLANSPYSDRL